MKKIHFEGIISADTLCGRPYSEGMETTIHGSEATCAACIRKLDQMGNQGGAR